MAVTATLFQSTPSAWRVTGNLAQYSPSVFISIHTLRMEGDGLSGVELRLNFISIHTLRMEGDPLVSEP